MVIAPENYLTEYADFTEENLFGASAKYDWAVDGVYNGSNGENGSPVRIINLTFNTLSADARIGTGVYCKGSIVNLLEHNLNNSFVARAYTKYTIVSNETTETHYVLANYYDNDRANNTRTMVNVANAVLKDTEANLKESDVEFLEKSYIDKYLDTVVQPVNGYPFDVDMSSGNSHTLNLTDITAENSKSAYVGGSTVKAVFVDDTRISDWTESEGEITIPHDTLAAFGKGEKIVRIWVNDGEKDLAYQGTLTLATKIISTAEELAKFGEYAKAQSTDAAVWDGHFILNADIQYNGEYNGFCNWMQRGQKVGAQYGFVGTFDGRGYTISGATFKNPTGGEGASFVSLLGKTGVIKNLAFLNAAVAYGNGGGAVVSDCYGTLENVFVEGVIDGTRTYGDSQSTLLVSRVQNGASVKNSVAILSGTGSKLESAGSIDIAIKTKVDGAVIENVVAVGTCTTPSNLSGVLYYDNVQALASAKDAVAGNFGDAWDVS
ncbi:MAG: hypothetical protein ACOX7H_09225, partial [Bacillota bacterium]